MIDQHTQDIYQESLTLHRQLQGKLATTALQKIAHKNDLALLYTPRVAAAACRAIAALVPEPTPDRIIPDALDRMVVSAVRQAVLDCAKIPS